MPPPGTTNIMELSKFSGEPMHVYQRVSIDSLCRDDADMPMMPYIRKACNRPNAAFVSLFR